MNGLKIGHFTHHEDGTGVSVFLLEQQTAIGAYLLCGSAPATHELATLDPETSVSHVHGLVFSGGSAYGLFAAKGVMTYLTERGIGQPTPHGVIPIVVAASLYDLTYKQASFPSAENAYEACLKAAENNQATGQIGAGAGATVGKLIPSAKRMTSGLGYAEMTLSTGVQVLVYAAVNAVGDIRNSNGDIIAGARDSQGHFANCEQFLLCGQADINLLNTNTTLVAIFTNAKFTKDALKRIAKMAAAGIARAISPVFTRFDGDIIFCISNGDLIASELTIGTVAAHVVQLAIIDAVKASEVV